MTEGRVIQGRYRLLSKLGQGGMGTVWRAVHLELGTPVAVKLIDPDAADSKLALSRFKREAQSAASLRGTNVVQILDYGIDDECPYIAMELLEGESLAARISRKAPLSPRETSRILGQVGKALARAHAQNIVHRDLKPDNIFIVRDGAPGADPDGEDEVTKVLDFGIAKSMSSASFEASIQTKSGAILGTPHYMSPEQASGRSTVDHRSDIWSLGVIAFECLTGCRPFNGATLGGLVIAICTEPMPTPSHVASVPRGFDEWFARCVHRQQSERFQSIAEAVGTLRVVCEPPALAGAGGVEWEEGREPTLQASHRASSLRLATELDRGEPARARSNPDQTVSAASRTLGTLPTRRSVGAYLSLALLVVGGAATSLVGYRYWAHPTVAASAQPSADALLATTPVSASQPYAAANVVATIAAPAVAIPTVAAPTVAAPTVAPTTAAASGVAPSMRRPANAKGKSAAPEVTPSTVVPARTQRLTESELSPPPQVTSLPTKALAPEPATRPDTLPTEPTSPPRKRNVEDRLAF